MTVSISSSQQQLTVPGVRIDRQSMDTKSSGVPSPTLQQTSSSSMVSVNSGCSLPIGVCLIPVPLQTLLSVPPTGYLVKQHSHPNLPSHTSTSLSGHAVLVQRQHSHPTGRVTQAPHRELVRTSPCISPRLYLPFNFNSFIFSTSECLKSRPSTNLSVPVSGKTESKFKR